MNNDAFLRHHGLTANPFRAEEARQDVVFDRIESECRHPDFDKIVGDLDHPSSSVVFGERGSGKTAIRLQITQLLHQRDKASNGQGRVWMVAYDDFNDIIDRFMRSIGEPNPDQALRQFSLVDHMDGILGRVVPSVIDGVLGERSDALEIGKDVDIRRVLRDLSEEARSQVLRLQICYDRPGTIGSRSARLKNILRLRGGSGVTAPKIWTLVLALTACLWAVAALFEIVPRQAGGSQWLRMLPSFLLLLVGGYTGFQWLTNEWRLSRTARQLQRAIRVDDRGTSSFRTGLAYLAKAYQTRRELPLDELDSSRYALFDGLIHLLNGLGYQSLMVLVDRIDEPTAINGDTDRMKSFVWPMFHNKFLQMRQVGVKMLLPLELRAEILREREGFFREARLDKQHLIERLAWSGAMLYDLCNARYRACLNGEVDKARVTIMNLFDEEVTRQEVVDALDQLQQPRDAFKFLYSLILEHCSNTTAEDENFSIARVTLDLVRKKEVQRKEGMLRGNMPA
ncbi:MAG: hypothetical protein KTR25_12030 [Myxococcales bacterium]|nr:hypothetical protein [Myxococcales bacterium]